jgi:hypothetical protein
MSVWPRCAVLLVLIGIAFCPSAPSVRAQPAPGTGSPVAASNWPHRLEEHGATVVVYQPQDISRPDHKILNARAAIEITPPGSRTTLVLGAGSERALGLRDR